MTTEQSSLAPNDGQATCHEVVLNPEENPDRTVVLPTEEPVSIDVSAFFPEGSTLTLKIVSPEVQGVLALNGSGKIKGTLPKVPVSQYYVLFVEAHAPDGRRMTEGISVITNSSESISGTEGVGSLIVENRAAL